MGEGASALVRTLFHYSEDPAIDLFRPHVAPTSRETEPFVWALDEEHAPSYWFPRDCPRACCWACETPILGAGARLLGLGGARRLHAIEAGWLERVRTCRLYAYEFDPAAFRPKVDAAGYWVAREAVTPLSVTPVGDLLARHAEAGIELRIVRTLWPLVDAITTSGLEYSIIRARRTPSRAWHQRDGTADGWKSVYFAPCSRGVTIAFSRIASVGLRTTMSPAWRPAVTSTSGP